MGTIIGGVFGVFLFSSIWEWLLFKRVFDDPMRGKISSVAAAYLSLSLLYGFNTARESKFVFDGFLIYLLGALIVSVYAWNRANKLKNALNDTDIFS